MSRAVQTRLVTPAAIAGVVFLPPFGFKLTHYRLLAMVDRRPGQQSAND